MKRILLFSLASLLLIGLTAGCQRESESESLYQANCMSCHGVNGEGLKRLVPPLAGSDFIQEYPDKLACIIRHGLEGKVVVNGVMYHHPMPGNKKLSEVDIANIINYINKSWYKGKSFVTPKEVERQLQACNN
ncbi:c-type cytochrome [Pontibacter actiniarum]|uniref:Cytochrome c domain-containing protein n=1 Tax=Pontibacter actiniarum TaxID=323450 RepID=A0A1X9YYU7_9BACT|nr:cytochrome c [Pontibacter actiniarum]ARS38085.1 hypothetical protein CA264_21295 [Pontibacter actiniarum]